MLISPLPALINPRVNRNGPFWRGGLLMPGALDA